MRTCLPPLPCRVRRSERPPMVISEGTPMTKPPYLGTIDGSDVFGPWENPLITKQIHQSHVETLTSMCAKRFEFEYARRTNFNRPSGGSINLGLGSASHVLINGIVEGRINHTNLIPEADKV